MIEYIIMLILGIFLLPLGIMNIKGNIQNIHRYNRTRITEETRPKYGKLMGLGTIIIGGGLILASILNLLFLSALFDLIGGILISIACVVGIAVMLCAQIKYNKGIF